MSSHDIVYSSHSQLNFFFGLESLKNMKNMENNRCSQNCPNEFQPGLAHYSMSFYSNHMTFGVSESQDDVVCWT
jgi:hypothetical protein